VRRVPPWIRFVNPVFKALLAAGVPMGPDVLLTVRGRKTGLARSTPVAVAEIEGRLWLISPWSEADWVRNLRAAGRATLTSGRRTESVSATELDQAQTIGFFRDILDPYVRTDRVARWFVRGLDRIEEDPVAAARGRVVFEIHRLG
jgi:deazaflavin-dependent oxidoreductase (nitroreductase family)